MIILWTDSVMYRFNLARNANRSRLTRNIIYLQNALRLFNGQEVSVHPPAGRATIQKYVHKIIDKFLYFIFGT